MRKTFITPSLEVKEFDKVVMLEVSSPNVSPAPEQTNLEAAKEFMGTIQYAEITL